MDKNKIIIIGTGSEGRSIVPKDLNAAEEVHWVPRHIYEESKKAFREQEMYAMNKAIKSLYNEVIIEPSNIIEPSFLEEKLIMNSEEFLEAKDLVKMQEAENLHALIQKVQDKIIEPVKPDKGLWQQLKNPVEFSSVDLSVYVLRGVDKVIHTCLVDRNGIVKRKNFIAYYYFCMLDEIINDLKEQGVPVEKHKDYIMCKYYAIYVVSQNVKIKKKDFKVLYKLFDYVHNKKFKIRSYHKIVKLLNSYKEKYDHFKSRTI